MPTTPPSITALPSAPDPTNRATFNTLAYPWSAALPTFGTQVSAVATNVKANADEAAGSATSAAAQVTLAAAQVTAASVQSAASAASAAAAAASANLKGTWASQTGAIAKPASVTHNSKVWGLLNNLADVTASQPGVTADWVDITPATNAYACQTTNSLVALSVTSAASQVIGTYVIDSTRTLLLIGSTAGLHAVVYNAGTYGASALVRTADVMGNGGIQPQARAVIISANAVLVMSVAASSTAFEAVVLTLTGSSITVGTAATATLAAAVANKGLAKIVTVGSSYVTGFIETTTPKAVACTVSGTTVTIGSRVQLGTLSANAEVALRAIDSTRFLALHTATTINIAVGTVSSGTTITFGTVVTITGIANGAGASLLTALSTGRWALIYSNTQAYGAIISVSGTTVTTSTVQLSASAIGTYNHCKLGDQIVVASTTTKVNVLTDASGTATAGTEITIPTTVSAAVMGFGTDFVVLCQATTGSPLVIKIIGNNAVLYDSPYTYTGSAQLLTSGLVLDWEVPSSTVLSTGTKSSNVLGVTASTAMSYDSTNGASLRLLPVPIYQTNNVIWRQSDTVLFTGIQAGAGANIRIYRLELV